MKKSIKKIVVLALILLVLPIYTSFAQMPNVVMQVSNEIKVGETTQIKISVDKNFETVSTIKFRYNTTLLGVEDDGSRTFKSDNVKVNKSGTEVVYENYNNKKDGDILLSVKALDRGEAEVEIEVVSHIMADESEEATDEELAAMKTLKVINVVPNVQNTQENSTQTTQQVATNEMSFITKFFNTVGNDWILKVLLIAIVAIFLIIVTLLIETMITAKRKKREALDNDDFISNSVERSFNSLSQDTVVNDMNIEKEDYRVNVSNLERKSHRNSRVVNKYPENDDNIYKVRDLGTRRERRELTPEEKKMRIAKLRSMQRAERIRELTPEQKRILLERRRKREQELQGNVRTVKRPARRNINDNED